MAQSNLAPAQAAHDKLKALGHEAPARWSLAVGPTSGHLATSLLATKATGAIDPMTRMSAHET